MLCGNSVKGGAIEGQSQVEILITQKRAIEEKKRKIKCQVQPLPSTDDNHTAPNIMTRCVTDTRG